MRSVAFSDINYNLVIFILRFKINPLSVKVAHSQYRGANLRSASRPCILTSRETTTFLNRRVHGYLKEVLDNQLLHRCKKRASIIHNLRQYQTYLASTLQQMKTAANEQRSKKVILKLHQ